MFIDGHNLQIDYRNCEETFLPFYPATEDARRVSTKRENIACVPLNAFYGSRRAVSRQNIFLASREARRSGRDEEKAVRSSQDGKTLEEASSRTRLIFDKLILPAVKRKHLVSDTGRLNYPLMREMLESIRQRARASGLPQLPVVLTNPPKDIRSLEAIKRFVGEVSEMEDVKFITLAELAGKVQSGEFKVSYREQEFSH